PGTPGAGDSLVFPLNGPAAPGSVNNDLAANTAFASITFLSSGWAINGNTIGITNAINDTTDMAGTNSLFAPPSFAAATRSVSLNVVNPSGAGNHLLSLNSSVALGNAGFTFSGFGFLGLAGTVSGAGSVVANGPGSLFLIGNNTYTGGSTVNNGLLIAQ